MGFQVLSAAIPALGIYRVRPLGGSEGLNWGKALLVVLLSCMQFKYFILEPLYVRHGEGGVYHLLCSMEDPVNIL